MSLFDGFTVEEVSIAAASMIEVHFKKGVIILIIIIIIIVINFTTLLLIS